VCAFLYGGGGVNQNAKVYGANALFLKKNFEKEKKKKENF
jgi:hypothetical protein